MRFPQFVRFFGYLNLIVLKRAVWRVFQRRLMGRSAEIAYNATLALFPAILAVLTAIGWFKNSVEILLNTIARPLAEIAPRQIWQLLRNFIDQIGSENNPGLFTLSAIAAIWISSAAVGATMNALDQIHAIPHQQRRPFWKSRIISLLLTVGTVILFFTASFLVLLSDFAIKLAVNRTGASILLALWRLLSWPLALAIVGVAFASLYRFGPSYHAQNTPILPGASLAAISWALISLLFRVYVGNFGNYNQIYGAVGTVIVLMLWLYLSSLVVLIGAQLNVTVGEAMAHRQCGKMARSPKRDRQAKSGNE